MSIDLVYHICIYVSCINEVTLLPLLQSYIAMIY